MAAINPIEQEGTYPLPEAQVDRFLFKLIVDYPSLDSERIILRKNTKSYQVENVEPVVSVDQIIEAQKVIEEIYVDEKVEDYILNLYFLLETHQNLD